ncbi:MAG TPA: NAD-dependent epimerase/dehydratase family protein [Gaiellaceae bacterium]
MRLLVLGGTKFLGRAAVEEALARGHQVTLFNRGQTNSDLFPEAEKLRGDRDGGLSALEGREWDAVIDPSGYVPRLVRDSASLLEGSTGHYLFVSSGSVYAEPYAPGYDETAPTVGLEDPASEEVLRDYGALKAACEAVVREVFPESHTNVRAGLIVGPHDGSGRFTYWPLRGSLGGDVLAPGSPEQLTQFVDVRDLGAWMVSACERRLSGTFNASGEPMTMASVLEACGVSEPVWVDEEFLLERSVGPWMELPLWIPGDESAFLQMSVAKAVAAGLSFRPVEETARDTLAWARETNAELVTETPYGTAGLDSAREAELLEAWRRHSVTLAP